MPGYEDTVFQTGVFSHVLFRHTSVFQTSAYPVIEIPSSGRMDFSRAKHTSLEPTFHKVEIHINSGTQTQDRNKYKGKSDFAF